MGYQNDCRPELDDEHYDPKDIAGFREHLLQDLLTDLCDLAEDIKQKAPYEDLLKCVRFMRETQKQYETTAHRRRNRRIKVIVPNSKPF